MKCRDWSEIEFETSKKVDNKTFYFVNSAFSNVMRSAPKSQTPTFDPPLDASGSELSSAGRIIAARQTCEAVAPHFWKRDEMFEFWAKCVHKVSKSCRSTDCTPAHTWAQKTFFCVKFPKTKLNTIFFSPKRLLQVFRLSVRKIFLCNLAMFENAQNLHDKFLNLVCESRVLGSYPTTFCF